MKTKAVRMYGKNDLRLEEFELPELSDDEILMEVVSDSVCMSTYKEVNKGEEHERVNKDISINPIIIGHETSGILRKIGSKWENKFELNESYSIQPAINLENSMSTIGYSFHYCGGAATYIILPSVVMEKGCLLPFNSKNGFYNASLSEPYSCIIGAFHAMYHTERGVYTHEMGIKKGGKSALLGSCGPMGLGAVDYMLNCDRRPSLLVVTDINKERLERAEKIFSKEYAKQRGVEIFYVDTTSLSEPAKALKEITGGTGFDDVSVFAPVSSVIEMADQILGFDGCLSFFSGPVDSSLSANFNFYNVHYKATHVVGTSGGNEQDMMECLELAGQGRLNPAVMVTHIGGMDALIDSTLNLPKIPGGKKMIYVGIDMALTAIEDFKKKGETDPLFHQLAKITEKNNGLWCAEAENYLLASLKK